MSDKYAALTEKCELIISQMKASHKDVAIYAPIMTWAEFESLLAERDADKRRIAELTDERDALREGEMGDAKHSNTRAAADIYFQLVEECQIPAGGSLVEHIDDMRQRVAELEARTLTVKLPDGYAVRSGHPINEGERGVMIPKEGGDWLYRFDVEHALKVAGISLKIEGE